MHMYDNFEQAYEPRLELVSNDYQCTFSQGVAVAAIMKVTYGESPVEREYCRLLHWLHRRSCIMLYHYVDCKLEKLYWYAKSILQLLYCAIAPV